MKTLLNYQLENEVSKANFNTVKRIYNRPPFMKVVYNITKYLSPYLKPDVYFTALILLANTIIKKNGQQL